jgi:hypothetical protein
MKKLSKVEEKETDVLANRIMPKTDFEKVIEHDKIYYNALNQAMEFNMIRQDVLLKRCQPILATQTKESIAKNINLLCDWAETQVKVLDLKGKLRIQAKLVEDKEMHFENVFLPQFNKEVEEAKANFDETLKQARKFVKTKREGVESIKEKIQYELTWWDKCDKKQQENDEYIVQIYKPLKRLLTAYDNAQNKA